MESAFTTVLRVEKLRLGDVSDMSKPTEVIMMGEEVRIWVP